MAVVDKYVDPLLQDGQKQDPNLAGGSRALIRYPLVSVAASDDDGSKYRLGKFNSNAVIFDVKVANSEITGGTDYDLGFYSINFGDAIEADLLLDGANFSSAARNVDGSSALAVEDFNKPLWELLGFSKDPLKQFDLVLTANTVGSADGFVSFKILMAQY